MIWHHWFGNFINLIIVGNVCTMAATDYAAQANSIETDRNAILARLEMLWLFIFTAEMLLKATPCRAAPPLHRP